MKPRILLTAAIPGPGMKLLYDAGEVTLLPDVPDTAALTALCASGDFDVLLSRLGDTVDADLLAAAKVRGVSNYAVGFNNIDVAAATEHGILVGNTPGVLTDATADVAMLLILGTARRVVEADTLVRSGQFAGWNPDLLMGADVSGQVLGLAGFGRIGRATARRALAFGMDVVFSPRPPEERVVSADELGEFAGKVRQLPWDEVVAQADFLSIHVPLNDQTRHLVDAAVLEAMKPSAFLVNTSRGPVVDEAALVTALREGVIAGAGLDVYENEPELASGLAELPNTVLLPHIGSATVPVRGKMAVLAARNAIAIGKGEMPEFAVNPEAFRGAE